MKVAEKMLLAILFLAMAVHGAKGQDGLDSPVAQEEDRELHAYMLRHATSGYMYHYEDRVETRPRSDKSWAPYKCCPKNYKAVSVNYKVRDMCRLDQIRDVKIVSKRIGGDPDNSNDPGYTAECGELYVRLESMSNCRSRPKPRVALDIVCMR